MCGEEKVEECQPFLCLSSNEIGGWMEKCWEDGGCMKCVEGESTEQ